MESRALGVRGWGCVGSLASKGKPVFGSLCCRISWLCVPLPTWAACLSWWNQVVHRIGVARFNVCVNVPSPLLFVLIAQLMERRSLPFSSVFMEKCIENPAVSFKSTLTVTTLTVVHICICLCLFGAKPAETHGKTDFS